MNYLLNILISLASSGTIVWLAKNWLSERLKQSIQYEYAQKLESHKTDMNSRIEELRHDYNVSQLRTSLFFEHQRLAFASILNNISVTIREWKGSWSPGNGVMAPVPDAEFNEFRTLTSQHKLFLDEECELALNCIYRKYVDSLPRMTGDKFIQEDAESHLSHIEYILPRLAALFRRKIGILSDIQLCKDLAILAAIELLANHTFPHLGLPPQGKLSIRPHSKASELVTAGRENFEVLIEKIRQLDDCLRQDGGFFQDSQYRVNICRITLDAYALQ